MEEKKRSKVITFPVKANANQHAASSFWKRTPVLATLIRVFIGAIVLSLSTQILGYLQQSQQLDAQIEAAKKQQEVVKEEQSTLQVQVQQLQNEEYVAKLARSEYLLAKNGEILFVLPNNSGR